MADQAAAKSASNSDIEEAYEAFRSDPAEFGEARIAATLHELFQTASAHTSARIAGFDRRARRVSGQARGLRWAALLFFIAGTMAPIVGGLALKLGKAFPKEPWAAIVGDLPIADIGYVLLAVAAGFVLYDQFFGSSRSWMRYRQAEARLQLLLAELRFGWAERLAAAGGYATDPATSASLVALLENHLRKVELLAETETTEWAQQFRAQIDAFDRNLQAARAQADRAAGGRADGREEEPGSSPGPVQPEVPARKPAVEVRLAINDFATLEPGSLQLSVDDRPLSADAEGFALAHVEPDQEHRFAARAKRDGRLVAAEAILKVAANDEGEPLALELA
jgi:hypothetical protein